MENVKLQGVGWVHEFDENGEWISKAVPIKKNVQHVHAEQPPYNVVIELEDRYNKTLNNHLAEALKDVVKYLNVS